MRRRLIHCQARTPPYFHEQFVRTPKGREDLRHKVNGNLNLKGTTNKLTNRQLPTQRPVSLSDQNKFPRTAYASSFPSKDHTLNKTRHTT